MRKIYITLFFGLLILAGCEEASTSSGNNDEIPDNSFKEVEYVFFTINKGDHSSGGNSEHIIRSEFEYVEHFGRSSNGFNFGEEMVLAVYKGEVALTGHDFRVSKIVEREFDVLVNIIFEPCNPCNTSSSSPFHVVGLDRTNKRFIFEEETIN